ncbi:unnamed protein product, partial [Symbiodinium sp. CCMP2456]
VPGFLECSTTHLSIFGGIVDVILRNVQLALSCSTLSSLVNLEALKKMAQPEWLQRPAAVVTFLSALVFLLALLMTHRWDQQSLKTLPWNERENLLMRDLKASILGPGGTRGKEGAGASRRHAED